MNKSIIASILTAISASLCCTGPLLFLLFGSTAFGIFSYFEQLYPVASVLAVGVLGYAYFNTFFSQKNSNCCETDKEITMIKQKKQKRLLLMVTPIVAGLLLFPYYVDTLFGQNSSKETQTTAITSEWKIDGMTCEGCARGLEGGMAATKGISSCKVDYANSTMICSIDKSVLNESDILGLVKKMGYKAERKDSKVSKISKAGILGKSGKSCGEVGSNKTCRFATKKTS